MSNNIFRPEAVLEVKKDVYFLGAIWINERDGPLVCLLILQACFVRFFWYLTRYVASF